MTRHLSLPLTILLSFLSMASASALETPDYTVTTQVGDFEIRQYAPYIVAEVSVDGDRRDRDREAFQILAGYIFGENRSKQKMAMTAPVESRITGEKMNMTAPVESRGSDDGDYVYAFVMESKYTMATLPQPINERIRLLERPARTMAAVSFSGSWSDGNVDAHREELLQHLQDRGLRPAGEVTFARYNSPFRPWFLRRNELLVEIARE